MFTKSDPSAQQAAMVIVPVRPAASPAQAPDTTRGLLRRTLGKSSYSRRTLGESTYSRRTLGRNNLLPAHPRQEHLLAPHPRQKQLLPADLRRSPVGGRSGLPRLPAVTGGIDRWGRERGPGPARHLEQEGIRDDDDRANTQRPRPSRARRGCWARGWRPTPSPAAAAAPTGCWSTTAPAS